MPESPWRTFGSSEPEREYVALLSYLPLKSYWRIPHFFFHTAQVVKQLASAEGVLGYSVLARPLSMRFWTLSVWKNEAALRTFVQYPPHVRIILLALGISGYFINPPEHVSVNQVSKDAQLGSAVQQLQIGIRALHHH
jgi:hypothetical protein